MTPQPPNPELAKLSNLVLFDWKNRAFVNGSRSYTKGKRGIYFLSVGFIVMSFVVLYIASNEISQWNTFIQQEQAATPGTVVAKEITTSCDGDGGCSDSYKIIYNFSLPVQQEVTYAGYSEVDRSAYERLHEGDSVEITYLPINPNISWMTGYDRHRDPTIPYTLLVLLVVGMTMVVMSSAVRLTLRTRRLMREGRVLQGEVTGMDVREGTDSDGATYVVTTVYGSFRTPDGRQILTRRVVSGARDWLLDAPLAVLYVNDNLYDLL
jgi:hypothetical protein